MIQQQTVGVHTHFHTHTAIYAQPPPPTPSLLLPFHHFSIFISVIYGKSNSCQSHMHTNTQKGKKRIKKHCRFTALGNSCCNIYSKDHSKILKTCHHRRSASASVTICFLLKHYTPPPKKAHAAHSLTDTISSLPPRPPLLRSDLEQTT